MALVNPLSSPTRYACSTLTKPADYPGVFLLELHARPDNRMTEHFIQSSLIAPLLDVEREYRASLLGLLAQPSTNSTGWKTPLTPGQYAIVTCGPQDKNRIYSNGLDLTEALALDHFFQHVLNPLYAKLLKFPIPTIAAINGHAFAGGFCLALAHDFRIMKENEQKGKALMAMNEAEFGAPVPLGLVAVVEAKLPTTSVVAKCLTEAHRFNAKEALELGIVHSLAPESEVVQRALKFGFDKSVRASTGVYGMIKESVYRETIHLLDSSGGGNADVKSIHTARLKHLSRHQSAHSKL
ncbi:hypothetical protein PTTG_05433 [Puccinia triticina 1-1 BBBD Race 1]|uniref:Enoyl-CoA hydratase n=2 Tax=Puccinia triticina TaxID=208348 RepID=A0A0C4EX85_PUCT1|nr:uncharacterized protein PtA15_6A546 [Puccinia triticina]OAV95376.1 hypothetical protein PTTG_05433 [Puccinia triticina 1-1 BBBD Race 1]WAQ85917.1 hypothetical protein PtA15_6A546 [Puccinia triticina]WAR55811.1 hypothetical protein PtB15_6B554 [Puccinia triticina]